MKDENVKIGATRLEGSAVRVFHGLKDDNHSLPADETAALANFDSFSESFFASQREFIKSCKK